MLWGNATNHSISDILSDGIISQSKLSPLYDLCSLDLWPYTFIWEQPKNDSNF